MSDTSTIQIPTETDLIGTLTSNFYAGATSFTATFIDKKTGVARAPQTNTITYTLDQDNGQSESIQAATVSTTNGITTITVATNGRALPKYGTGAGNNTGLDHVVGAAVGCVDIALPLNLIAQILGQKANIDGQQFTGLVSFLEPTGLLELPNLTTTERDAIASPQEGMIIKNKTTGAINAYLTGTWQVLGISTATPNASTSVAGKVQMAIQADFDSGTATGGTGAFNVGNPAIVQTSIQNSASTYILATGSANAYVLTYVPAVTAYVAGQTLKFQTNFANTGAVTVNVNGLGAIALHNPDGSPLLSGALLNNQIVQITYTAAGDFKLTNWSRSQTLSGTTTYDLGTATGTQTITHGLGRIPALTTINAGVAQNEGGGHFGVHNSNGTYNGTLTASLISNIDLGVAAATMTSSTTNIIDYEGFNSTGSQIATITVDATNITLHWTKSSNPAGTLQIVWTVTG